MKFILFTALMFCSSNFARPVDQEQSINLYKRNMQGNNGDVNNGKDGQDKKQGNDNGQGKKNNDQGKKKNLDEQNGKGNDEKGQDNGKKNNDEGKKNNDEGKKNNDEGKKNNDEGKKNNDQGKKNNDEGKKNNDQGKKNNDEGKKNNDQGKKNNDQGKKNVDNGKNGDQNGKGNDKKGKNGQNKDNKAATGAAAAKENPNPLNDKLNGEFKGLSADDFCSKFKLALADGTQNKKGSCSQTIQGAIPSFDKMTSTLIIDPKSGANLDATKDNKVTIDIANLETGFFSNATTEYYALPQILNDQGVIRGHQHITVQTVGNGKAALDARNFDFFKGLNDESGDGRTLSVTIPAGTFKQNGEHRICSITGTFNHQPVLMPVAQRGSQDDCIRITVKGA